MNLDRRAICAAIILLPLGACAAAIAIPPIVGAGYYYRVELMRFYADLFEAEDNIIHVSKIRDVVDGQVGGIIEDAGADGIEFSTDDIQQMKDDLFQAYLRELKAYFDIVMDDGSVL